MFENGNIGYDEKLKYTGILGTYVLVKSSYLIVNQNNTFSPRTLSSGSFITLYKHNFSN